MDWALSQNYDQTYEIPRLIWIFAGRMKNTWVLTMNWALSQNSDQTNDILRLIIPGRMKHLSPNYGLSTQSKLWAD